MTIPASVRVSLDEVIRIAAIDAGAPNQWRCVLAALLVDVVSDVYRELPSGDAPPSELDTARAVLEGLGADVYNLDSMEAVASYIAHSGTPLAKPSEAEASPRHRVRELVSEHGRTHSTQWAAMDTLLDVALGCGRWLASEGAAPVSAREAALIAELRRAYGTALVRLRHRAHVNADPSDASPIDVDGGGDPEGLCSPCWVDCQWWLDGEGAAPPSGAAPGANTSRQLAPVRVYGRIPSGDAQPPGWTDEQTALAYEQGCEDTAAKFQARIDAALAITAKGYAATEGLRAITAIADVHRLLSDDLAKGDAPQEPEQTIRALVREHGRTQVEEWARGVHPASDSQCEHDLAEVMGCDEAEGPHTWGDLLAELRLRLGGGVVPPAGEVGMTPREVSGGNIVELEPVGLQAFEAAVRDAYSDASVRGRVPGACLGELLERLDDALGNLGPREASRPPCTAADWASICRALKLYRCSEPLAVLERIEFNGASERLAVDTVVDMSRASRPPGGAEPMPDGWRETAGSCTYGIEDGSKCVWVEDDGLSVSCPAGGAVPLAAVRHVLDLASEGAAPPPLPHRASERSPGCPLDHLGPCHHDEPSGKVERCTPDADAGLRGRLRELIDHWEKNGINPFDVIDGIRAAAQGGAAWTVTRAALEVQP